MPSKWERTVEAKIDALLEKAGIKPDDVVPEAMPEPMPRELSKAEQEAIDRAPKPTPVAQPAVPAPRVDAATNAPVAPATVPPQAVPPAPWPDYDSMSVGDIISRARTTHADVALRNRILAYERANKNRNGVITPLVNWNS